MIPNKSRQVLLIGNETIHANMTGPAIRYWEFARVLSRYFSVTLAIPPLVQGEFSLQGLTPTFEVRHCQTLSELKQLTHQTDVIITVGANLSLYPFLATISKPLVVDMYIPFMLEDLEKYKTKSITTQNLSLAGTRGAHTLQIRSADFIICASEKQRDFWLGWLSALGRVNPYTHQDDPTLARLIDVVPFGLPGITPTHDKGVIKGVHKAIAGDDRIILWGGGLWDWLDPQTLIKAVADIAPQHPNVKLFFMGIKSPNPSTAKMNTAAQAIALSRELGVYEKSVFFNDWVPYHERHNYLLEADIGVSLHRNHLETRFSFRTRLLDYIWTSLPILATKGDVFSQEIKKYHLGKVVKSEDVADVRRALLELLEIPNLRQHYQPYFDQIRPHYEWEVVTRPLIKFCETPYIAADKPYLKQISVVEPGISSWVSLPGKIFETVRNYGLPTLLERSKEYIRWKLKR